MEFIAQWAFYSFLFWHRCNAKFVIRFSLFSRDPDGRSISNLYRCVILCIWWIQVLTLPVNCFVSKKQFCNVPLKKGIINISNSKARPPNYSFCKSFWLLSSLQQLILFSIKMYRGWGHVKFWGLWIALEAGSQGPLGRQVFITKFFKKKAIDCFIHK